MWNNTKLSGGLREITTKATCAKGQKRFRQIHSIVTANPAELVLGSRITSHSYVASPLANSVEIKGSYDIHIWYTYADGTLTAVEKKTVRYMEHLPVIDLEGERLGQEESVEATVTREPEVVGMHVRRGAVQVEVDLEFYVEIVGETKLWVKVYEPPFADDKKAKALDLDVSGDYFDEDAFDDDEYDDEWEDEDEDYVL
ncbi:MAG: outer spore coat protein CotE [Firmicutes bacterium]|nr:outer spore coat protein CotE [Bacillota bacterium]